MASAPAPAPVGRTVVSYVRRSPRMSPGQRRALATLAQRYLLTVPRGRLDTSIAPGASIDWQPDIVEIGSGAGEALVALARRQPTARLLAFEVYERAIAACCTRLAATGVDNVRIVGADAVQGLEVLLAPGSVHLMISYFPDPWPKKRHHKRRLIQPGFAALVASRLAPGGRWLLATDWPDYAEQMRAVLDACPGLVNEHAGGTGWAPRPGWRPVTRFERRGLAAGRPVRDLAYRKPS